MHVCVLLILLLIFRVFLGTVSKPFTSGEGGTGCLFLCLSFSSSCLVQSCLACDDEVWQGQLLGEPTWRS